MISVVIVTHNAAGEIGRCLRALPAAAGASSIEIIVVDAQSSDHTASQIAASGVAVTVVRAANQGFAAGANLGVGYAQGDFLLFLNSDVVLPPASIPRLVRLCRQERVAAVSGQLVDAYGRSETVGEPFPSLSWYLRRRFPSRPVHCSLLTAHSVPFLSGAALLVSTGAFRHVGGFRTSYFLYYEDLDLCHRLRSQGGVLLLDPSLQILHDGGRSASPRERLRHSDRAEDQYFSDLRPRWERRALAVMRRMLRFPHFALILSGVLAGTLLMSFEPRVSLAVALGSVLLAVAARSPHGGAWLLLSTLIPGQLVRAPLLGFGEVTLTDVALPIVLVGWLLSWLVRGDDPSRPPGPVCRDCSRLWPSHPVFLALVLGFSAVLPGLLLALERLPHTDWLIAAGYAGRMFFLVLLAVLAAVVLKRRGALVVSVVTVGVVLALLGFVQLWLFPSLQDTASVSRLCSLLTVDCSLSRWDPHLGRLFSTWLDPNLLGGLFVLQGALLLTIPAGGRRRVLVLSLLAAGILGSALVLTKSRTSLVALAAVAGASLLLFRSWRRLVPLLLVGAAGLFLVPSFAQRVRTVNLEDPTTVLRIESWRQALAVSAQRPLFGVGYNAYAFEQLALGRIPGLQLHSRAGADNSWLTLQATTGWWGVSILAALLVLLLRALLHRSRSTVAPDTQHPISNTRYPIPDIQHPSPIAQHHPSWLPRAALLALLGLLVHSQFVHSFLYIHLAVPVALLVGMAFSPRREIRPHP